MQHQAQGSIAGPRYVNIMLNFQQMITTIHSYKYISSIEYEMHNICAKNIH